jgi:hypothetical protein
VDVEDLEEEEQAVSRETTPSMEERVQSPPLADQEAERPTRSEGKRPEATLSQHAALSSSQRPE